MRKSNDLVNSFAVKKRPHFLACSADAAAGSEMHVPMGTWARGVMGMHVFRILWTLSLHRLLQHPLKAILQAAWIGVLSLPCSAKALTRENSKDNANSKNVNVQSAALSLLQAQQMEKVGYNSQSMAMPVMRIVVAFRTSPATAHVLAITVALFSIPVLQFPIYNGQLDQHTHTVAVISVSCSLWFLRDQILSAAGLEGRGVGTIKSTNGNENAIHGNSLLITKTYR